MEKNQHIIGADLSKKTIDLFCITNNNYLRIDNNAIGFKELLKWLKRQQINLSSVLLVMEHTGLYSFCLEAFLHHRSIAFTKVSALAIKRSLGIVRGKSDKIDCRRIAQFGFEKQLSLRPEQPVEQDLQQLQLLHTTRDRLVKQKAALLNAVKEYTNIGLTSKHPVIQSQLVLIKNFEKEITKLETQMNVIIENNPSLYQNRLLLQSIKGVGKILSVATLIKTRNFTRFTNARKFACYCGTAPFEHSSGTSIKGKTKVSHLADKQMKTLLDLSAKTAIQYDKELRDYYLRRIEMGKSKMSTINIVRNKIIYRMFAVVKRQTPFVEEYLQVA